MPRTMFSSKLPIHNFANIWNELDQTIDKAKRFICKQFIDPYLNIFRCYNPMCNECNNNQIII